MYKARSVALPACIESKWHFFPFQRSKNGSVSSVIYGFCTVASSCPFNILSVNPLQERKQPIKAQRRCIFRWAKTKLFLFSGSISNIDGAEYHCNKTQVRKVISGVVGAASSVTSIQVANLLRLFKIPQVSRCSIFVILFTKFMPTHWRNFATF